MIEFDELTPQELIEALEHYNNGPRENRYIRDRAIALAQYIANDTSHLWLQEDIVRADQAIETAHRIFKF